MWLFGKKAVVKDPVCGMDIDPKQATANSAHMGATYYFCSRRCKEEFDKDPMTHMASAGRPQSGGHCC